MTRVSRRYEQFRIENDRERLKRWRSGYVTERERRLVVELRERAARNISLSPAQADWLAEIQTIAPRR